MTQNQKILIHLQKGRGITTLEAYDMFGCTRLSARIHDLRDMGYTIFSRMIEVPTRTGEKAHVCEYKLVKEAGECVPL